MGNVQPGILAPVPKLARYLNFSLKAGVKPRHALPKTVSRTRCLNLRRRFPAAIFGVRRCAAKIWIYARWGYKLWVAV